MVRIVRAGAAVHAVRSIHAVSTAGAGAAGEVRDELAVIAHGNIKICADVRMAGHGDGDMRELPVADPGILGKGQNAFLVGDDDTWRDREVLP
jgi:hypothetical protein